MDYYDFVGDVITRLELSSRAEDVQATRSVLTTLSERIQVGEAKDFAGALPMEIDFYVLNADHGQDFGKHICGKSERKIRHGTSRCSLLFTGHPNMVEDAIPEGELEDIRANLPEEFEEFFELVDEED